MAETERPAEPDLNAGTEFAERHPLIPPTVSLHWVLSNPGRIVCDACLRNSDSQRLTLAELRSDILAGIADCEDCGARDSRS